MLDGLGELLLTSDVLASAALILVLISAHVLVGRALKRRDSLPLLVARRWTANLRNLLLVVALIGLAMIWAPQLRTFALSLTAFAVAMVVAMKELILCLSGSALRTFSRIYSVGDYVEIGGRRGEVLDHSLLVTRLKEFEAAEGSFEETGREIILPHSLLFSSPVRREGRASWPVRHSFQMTFEPDANLFAAQNRLEEAALNALASITKVDGKILAQNTSDAMRDASASPVSIAIGTSDVGKYRLTVTVLVQPEMAGDAEKVLTCAIGDCVHRLSAPDEIL